MFDDDAHLEPVCVNWEDMLVESWRLKTLIDAGYPVLLAERLAASKADLHQSCGLLQLGCEPELAARILL